MNISPISFGKKIPITRCQIQDTNTDKFEPAIVSRIDCTDESDILEIKNLPDTWQYKLGIAKNMERKHHLIKNFGQENDSTFYVIQDKDNQIIGLSEISETDDKVYDLTFLESNASAKKKYIGQALLAAVAEDVLRKNGTEFTIYDAVDSAYDFYKDVCGFEDILGFYLKMDRKQMNQFIEQTEDRTQGLLVDLRG